MLNKKFIVGIIVVVIAFLGIYTFALNNDNTPTDEPKNQGENNGNNNGSNNNQDKQDEVADEEEEGNQAVAGPNAGPRQEARDTLAPVIALVGDSEITIDLNGTYTEQGATATDARDGDLTSAIVVSGSVDTKTAGVYELTYTVRDAAGNEASVTRKVVVRPVIALVDTEKFSFDNEDETGKTLLVGTGSFVVPDAKALLGVENEDDVEVEGEVKNEVGTYTLTFRYSLNVNGTNVLANPLVITIKVVDTTAPTLNFYDDGVNSKGTSTSPLYLTIEAGTDLDKIAAKFGYKVYDVVDGVLADHVNKTVAFVDDAVTKTFYKYNESTKEYEEISKINTKVSGKYKIEYSVSDSSNNTTTKVRIVTIVDTTAPTLNFYDDGVNSKGTSTSPLYLTIEAGTDLDKIAAKFGYKVYDVVDGTLADHVNKTVAFVDDAVTKTFYKYNESTEEYEKISKINTKVSGKYKIEYSVSDSSNNTTTKVRIVTIVDTTAPTLNFYDDGVNSKGTSTSPLYLTIEAGTDLDKIAAKFGYKVYDVVDGTLADHVNKTVAFVDDAVTKTFYKYNESTKEYEEISKINTKIPGIYKIEYSVSDSSNNRTTKVRIVTIKDTTAPTLNFYDDGVNSKGTSTSPLYLTIEAGTDLDKIAAKFGYKVYDVVDGTLADHVNKTVAFVDDAVTKTFYKYNESTKEYEKISKINTKIPGIYKIEYSVSDSSNNRTTKVRIVTIVDTTAPTVTANPSNGTAYRKSYKIDIDTKDVNKVTTLKYLWTTTDEKPEESEITNNVKNKRVSTPAKANGTYYLWIFVEDNQGNKDVVLAGTYNLDNEAPVIKLRGESPVNVEYESTYTDLGVEVTDNFDANVRIDTVNLVNTKFSAVYYVVYTAIDDAGNIAIESRTVRVLPSLTIPEDETIEINTDFKAEKATVRVSPFNTFKINPKSNNVDTTQVGEYFVVYEVEYLGMRVTKTMRVTVVDSTIPRISIEENGNSTYAKQHDVDVSAYDDSGIKTLKYLWSKRNTGVLDSKIVNEVNGKIYTPADVSGIWYLWVYAEDNNGLKDTKVSEGFYLDNTKPTIIVNPTTETVLKGTTYNPLNGVTASDSESGIAGAITSNYQNSWINIAGEYTITYTVTDNVGNTSTATRTLIVEEPAPEYTLYTFDFDNTGNYPKRDLGNVKIEVKELKGKDTTRHIKIEKQGKDGIKFYAPIFLNGKKGISDFNLSTYSRSTLLDEYHYDIPKDEYTEEFVTAYFEDQNGNKYLITIRLKNN